MIIISYKIPLLHKSTESLSYNNLGVPTPLPLTLYIPDICTCDMLYAQTEIIVQYRHYNVTHVYTYIYIYII